MAKKKNTEGTRKVTAPASSPAKKPMAASPVQVAAAAAAGQVAASPSPVTLQNYVGQEDQIRRRAFQISQSQKSGHSNPEQNWLQAEHEILGKSSK